MGLVALLAQLDNDTTHWTFLELLWNRSIEINRDALS